MVGVEYRHPWVRCLPKGYQVKKEERIAEIKTLRKEVDQLKEDLQALAKLVNMVAQGPPVYGPPPSTGPSVWMAVKNDSPND